VYVVPTEVEDPVVEKMNDEEPEDSQYDLSSSVASTEVDDTAVEKSTDVSVKTSRTPHRLSRCRPSSLSRQALRRLCR
jgi:hypothetical protein